MKNVAVEIKVLNHLIIRDLEQRARLAGGDMISGINGMIMGYIRW